MQRWLLWCVFAGSSLEVKIETDSNDAVKIKTEADSYDITEYPCDTLPSVGMFGLFHMKWGKSKIFTGSLDDLPIDYTYLQGRGGKISTVWLFRQLASKWSNISYTSMLSM